MGEDERRVRAAGRVGLARGLGAGRWPTTAAVVADLRKRIVAMMDGPERPADLAEADEQALYQAYQEVAAAADGTVPTLIAGLRTLRLTINQFFDNLLVNADEPDVRANRLALLTQVDALFADIADFTRIAA